ncbi:MAG: hypothetical protein AAGI17_00970 [Planctomycetota bacterium]
MIRRLVVCFGLGLLTTIAVAWLLALRPIAMSGNSNSASIRALRDIIGEDGFGPGTMISGRDTRWFGGVIQGWRIFERDDMRWAVGTSDQLTATFPLGVAIAGPLSWGRSRDLLDRPEPPAEVADIAFGWPAYAVWCEMNDHRQRQTLGNGAIPIRDPDLSGRPYGSFLPFRPILSGLAFDTLFFGALWFAAFSLVNQSRRYRRFKRGRCPRCSYDLAFDYRDGCSECGWRRGVSNDAESENTSPA